MTQSERREYLIQYLLKEERRLYGKKMPADKQGQENLLRSLMNVRLPKPISGDFLKIQDEYLKERNFERGITDIADLKPVVSDTGLYLWQGDITRLQAEAIVNAANSQMLGCFVPCHGCIDNAIHSAAGIQLREACSHYMRQRKLQYGRDYEEPTGRAMLTEGYNLPAQYVIHTVGPIVSGHLNPALREDLRNCYWKVLECCVEHKIRSVAFCCISTGEFHFPNDEAAHIAVETATEFLKAHGTEFDRIIFNVFKDVDRELYERELR